ncbi:hypothetical protein CHH26_09290 [Qipengyuania flava]|nr:hypothetical protein CHH26_09290 [Qipengyuania flava]
MILKFPARRKIIEGFRSLRRKSLEQSIDLSFRHLLHMAQPFSRHADIEQLVVRQRPEGLDHFSSRFRCAGVVTVFRLGLLLALDHFHDLHGAGSFVGNEFASLCPTVCVIVVADIRQQVVFAITPQDNA